MKMPRILLALVGAVLLTAYSSSVHAQGKIAVVDLQRAIQETEDGRKAKAKLKKLFKKRQDGLDKKQTELLKLKEELEKKQSVLTPEAMQAKVQDYQKQLAALQQVYMENQRELASKEQELTKGIVARMEKILRRIGQKKGYTLILERGEAGVIWVPSNLDLTDAVIQKYNAGEGK